MEIGSIDSKIPAPGSTGPVLSVESRAEQGQLIKAVKAVNEAEMFGQNTELTFVLDRHTRRPLVRLVDVRTNEVIRQVPAESVLRMAEDLGVRSVTGTTSDSCSPSPRRYEL